jgi:hypothetical protein
VDASAQEAEGRAGACRARGGGVRRWS